jgi:predicted RNA binding protein YcfA (HicA-like mRNA interferase family)
MSKYPSVTGKRLIKELLRIGYIFLRQKGSHVSIGHPKNKMIFTVVMDTSDDLCPETLNNIKKSLRLSRNEFMRILQDC